MTNFLDIYDTQLFADFGERFFTIKFKDQTSEKTLSTVEATQVQTSTTDTANINPMVLQRLFVLVFW